MSNDLSLSKQQKLYSYKIKFIVLFAFFILLSCGIISVLASYGILHTGETFATERGFPICDKTATYIDGDKFEALAKSEDLTDPFYEETRLWMLNYKQMVDCKYLYTMAHVDGTIYKYVIDGSCDPSDEENFSPMGTEEDLSSWGPAVFDVIEKGGKTTSGLEQQDNWGWTISTYQSISNSKSEIVGFIGCDFDVAFLVTTITK